MPLPAWNVLFWDGKLFLAGYCKHLINKSLVRTKKNCNVITKVDLVIVTRMLTTSFTMYLMMLDQHHNCLSLHGDWTRNLDLWIQIDNYWSSQRFSGMLILVVAKCFQTKWLGCFQNGCCLKMLHNNSFICVLYQTTNTSFRTAWSSAHNKTTVEVVNT